MPLAPSQDIPEEIDSMDSHEIPRVRSDPLLLAVMVISKSIPSETTISPAVQMSPEKQVAGPSMSPPNPEITNTFSPVTMLQPTSMSPPTQQPAVSAETFGLSPADLAALQTVLLAHPEILSKPQILTNPTLLQTLIQQHLSGQQQHQPRW